MIKIFKKMYTTIKINKFKNKYTSNVRGLSYAYLVGLIEGAGWISISKKGKYLTYELGLELNVKDIQLLYKIKDALGVGKITKRVRKGINNDIYSARYNIRNKQHFKEIIIPIFDKYSMLTNKQFDYLRFREALLNDIIFYDHLPKYSRPKISLNSVDTILSKSYFSSWLVGFIEAEACFSVYKSKINYENSYVGSFDIAQTKSFEIIEAIKSLLNISVGIYKDNTNSFKLKTTSVRNIENIITFLKNNPIRLLGNKRLQYLLFLKKLRKIPKYSNKINIPNNY
jgi:LAGLIDADG endonuclease